MKTIKTLFVVLALSATFAFGDDGHTNGGNRCDTCTPPACTENCGGSAGDGQQAVIAPELENDETTLIEYWSEVFFELIG